MVTPIGGTDYTFRFWWADKNKTWYFDLEDEERRPLAQGMAVVPGAVPLPRALGVRGVIGVSGDDYTDRFALGRTVQVVVID